MLEEILELTHLNVRNRKARPELPTEIVYELVRGIERIIEMSEFADPEALSYIERPLKMLAEVSGNPEVHELAFLLHSRMARTMERKSAEREMIERKKKSE